MLLSPIMVTILVVLIAVCSLVALAVLPQLAGDLLHLRVRAAARAVALVVMLCGLTALAGLMLSADIARALTIITS